MPRPPPGLSPQHPAPREATRTSAASPEGQARSSRGATPLAATGKQPGAAPGSRLDAALGPPRQPRPDGSRAARAEPLLASPSAPGRASPSHFRAPSLPAQVPHSFLLALLCFSSALIPVFSDCCGSITPSVSVILPLSLSHLLFQCLYISYSIIFSLSLGGSRSVSVSFSSFLCLSVSLARSPSGSPRPAACPGALPELMQPRPRRPSRGPQLASSLPPAVAALLGNDEVYPPEPRWPKRQLVSMAK